MEVFLLSLSAVYEELSSFFDAPVQPESSVNTRNQQSHRLQELFTILTQYENDCQRSLFFQPRNRKVTIEKIENAKQLIEIKLAVSSSLFAPIKSLYEQGTFKISSNEQLLLLCKELPQIQDVLSEGLFKALSLQLVEYVNSSCTGCCLTIDPQWELIVGECSQDVPLDALLSLCSKVLFESSDAFDAFLRNYKGVVFDSVQTVVLDFTETIACDDSKHIARLFPRIQVLETSASTLEAEQFVSLVNEADLLALFCRGCSDLNQIDLYSWNSGSVFFVGDIVPNLPESLEVQTVENATVVLVASQNCFSFHFGITDAELMLLTECSLDIKELHLSESEEVTDIGVCAFVRLQQSLEALSFEGCLEIGDTSFKAISECCPELQELTASDTAITDEGLMAIASKCNKLSSLDISYTNVSDVGLIHFLKLHPFLEKLAISGCDEISEEVLEYVVENNIRIDRLVIDGAQFDSLWLDRLSKNQKIPIAIASVAR